MRKSTHKSSLSFPAGFRIGISLLLLLLATMFPLRTHAGQSGDPGVPERPRVGLVLSGGGARGIAHVGVIQALEDAGIPIDYIAGTSMGSIVGGLYAAGYNGIEMQTLVDSLNWRNIFSQAPEPGSVWVSKRYGLMKPIFQLRFKFWNLYLPTGLINGQRISREFFRLTAPANYAAYGDFDSLQVPFRAVAVDIATGRARTLGRGSLAQAMRSSMAIPLIFYPAVYNNQLMVDGGVLKVLPTDVAREMGADVVIAVDVTKPLPGGRIPENLVKVANLTLDIIIRDMEQKSLEQADVVIRPPVGFHPESSYSGLDSLIRLGRQATMEKMDQIKHLIARKSRSQTPVKASLDTSLLRQATITDIRVIGHRLVISDSTSTSGKLPPSDLFNREELRKRIVLSYFPLKVGERFRMQQALQGVDNLYATGLFQNVWLELDRTGPDAVRINIHFVENALRTIGFGANYRSEEGPSFFAQIVPFSFLGSGTLIMPLVRVGELRTRAGLEISNGRIFSTPYLFYTGLYYDEEQPYTYDQEGNKTGQLRTRRFLGQASFGLQPTKQVLISVGIRGEQVQSAEVDQWEHAAITRRGALFGQLIVDTRNHQHFPDGGMYFSSDARINANVNHLPAQYSLLATRYESYIPLARHQTVYFYGTAGISEGELPRYSQFRFGGPQDLPGYHREEQWGNYLFAAGLGYRWEFSRNLYWQTDWRIGNVYHTISEVAATNLLMGLSTGLRIASPLGPLAFSYGWNTADRSELYFSLGYDF